jgi:hypothetical protein
MPMFQVLRRLLLLLLWFCFSCVPGSSFPAAAEQFHSDIVTQLGHHDIVDTVAWSPDGHTVLTGQRHHLHSHRMDGTC